MRYAALDGWRGICALLVAIYHFNTNTAFSFSTPMRHSFLFVEFFFLLSGFVLCHAYGDSIRQGRDLLYFAAKRVARLWPLHIVLLLSLVPIALAQHWLLGIDDARFSVAGFAANLLLIQALGIFDNDTWNFVAWSISVELYTCLLFAAVALWTRHIVVYALLSVCGAVVLYFFGSLEDTYHFALFRGIYSFFLGCCVYRLFESPWSESFKLKSKVCFTLLELCGLVAVVTYLSWGVHYVPFIFSPLLFALVVWIFAFDRGALSQLLSYSLLQKLGLYSYSIYLVHGVLVTAIKGGLVVLQKWLHYPLLRDYQDIKVIDLGSEANNLLATLTFVLLLYGIAAMTYRWIERPGQQWMNKKRKAAR